jgi:hypothetical protein
MKMLLLIVTLLLGTWIWWNHLPTKDSVLVRVHEHHANLRKVRADEVACRILEPRRPEERESARFHLGCKDASTSDGSLWVYVWQGIDTGRGFSTPQSPLKLEEGDAWNR